MVFLIQLGWQYFAMLGKKKKKWAYREMSQVAKSLASLVFYRQEAGILFNTLFRSG
jgi:hypothetical protein